MGEVILSRDKQTYGSSLANNLRFSSSSAKPDGGRGSTERSVRDRTVCTVRWACRAFSSGHILLDFSFVQEKKRTEKSLRRFLEVIVPLRAGRTRGLCDRPLVNHRHQGKEGAAPSSPLDSPPSAGMCSLRDFAIERGDLEVCRRLFFSTGFFAYRISQPQTAPVLCRDSVEPFSACK